MPYWIMGIYQPYCRKKTVSFGKLCRKKTVRTHKYCLFQSICSNSDNSERLEENVKFIKTV